MPPTTDGSFQTARIIWMALLAGLASYLVVLVVLLGQPGPPPASGAGQLRGILLVLAAASAGGLLYFKSCLPGLDRDPTRPAAVTMPPYTVYVICWALAESIALYGLVLGFLLRSLPEAAPFFIAGAALLLWLRPRAAHFGRDARSVPGA